jgi:hypothetical protein
MVTPQTVYAVCGLYGYSRPSAPCQRYIPRYMYLLRFLKPLDQTCTDHTEEDQRGCWIDASAVMVVVLWFDAKSREGAIAHPGGPIEARTAEQGRAKGGATRPVHDLYTATQGTHTRGHSPQSRSGAPGWGPVDTRPRASNLLMGLCKRCRRGSARAGGSRRARSWRWCWWFDAKSREGAITHPGGPIGRRAAEQGRAEDWAARPIMHDLYTSHTQRYTRGSTHRARGRVRLDRSRSTRRTLADPGGPRRTPADHGGPRRTTAQRLRAGGTGSRQRAGPLGRRGGPTCRPDDRPRAPGRTMCLPPGCPRP